MTDTTITCQWLDQQLAECRQQGGDAKAVLERWLARVKDAWGDLSAQYRAFRHQPLNNAQARAVERVLVVDQRLKEFETREKSRNYAGQFAKSLQAKRTEQGQAMVWQRDFRDLESGLYHFAALRGVCLKTARGMAIELAERYHSEVVALYKSRLARIDYGVDGARFVFDKEKTRERAVNHGGVTIQKAFRPSPGADYLVTIAFFRSGNNIGGRNAYLVTLPLDFDPSTVELPKPKARPPVHEAAIGSANLVSFLRPLLGSISYDPEDWFRRNLGGIVAQYCKEEGIQGIPGQNAPWVFGGSQIDRWSPKKRKWIVRPGLSLAGIDLATQILTVQVAMGNGCRQVPLPLSHLANDFPKTVPMGDGIVRIDRTAGPVQYAAVRYLDNGAPKVVCLESLAAVRKALKLPELPEPDPLGADPWQGCLIAGIPTGESRPVPAHQHRIASDFTAASAALASGLF